MALFSSDDLAALSGPHVQRAFFFDVIWPTERRRYHTGTGPVEIGGFTWQGVNDPFGAALVSLGEVEEPRFGTAPAISILFSGANKDFLREVWTTDLEGVACDPYFAAFNAESGAVVVGLRKLFEGKVTAPMIECEGLAVRAVSVRIVDIEEGLNYPVTQTQWSPAGHRSRYPGSKGMDYVGSKIIVDFKP